jgi:hypothetical protein
MNIFALSDNPYIAATMHCDKHVVKMIVEYAQLLSTAHRLLDGVPTNISIADERRVRSKTVWLLHGESTSVARLDGRVQITIENRVCYTMTHGNHPSAVWARENAANYQWLFRLFDGCLMEYTRRYGRTHQTESLLGFFRHPPKNIPASDECTPIPQAMPVEYQVLNDPISAYRNFYIGAKIRFARYTNAPIPEWFRTAIIQKGLNVADFIRTR